jgi:hypothetical protein
MIRAVDSSLLDEWEQMRDPEYERRVAAERAKIVGADLRPPGAEAAADITRDVQAFTAAVRHRIFTFLRAWANREFEAALAALDPTSAPSPEEPATAPTTADSAGTASSPSLTTRSAATPEAAAADSPWSAARLEQALAAYLAGHARLLLTPEARNRRHTHVIPSDDPTTWRVQQMLVDPDGHNDWVAEFVVDLAAAREAGEPRLRLVRLGPLV